MTVPGRIWRFRSFWIFPGVSAALFGATMDGAWRTGILLYLPAGLLLWTFLEYVFHRFLFHTSNRFLSGTHPRHHRNPLDLEVLFVSPTRGLLLSAGLYGLVFLVLRQGLPTTCVMSGIWTGFLYYESVHYRIHRSASQRRLLRLRREAHFRHHFMDPGRNFGVTSPLWDYVFGTN